MMALYFLNIIIEIMIIVALAGKKKNSTLLWLVLGGCVLFQIVYPISVWLSN